MQQRRREQEIGTQPLVQLGRLPADSRHADSVLEQAARVGVMRLGGRESPEGRADRLVVEEAQHRCAQAGMCHLRREELEEALQLVRVTADRRRKVSGIRFRRRLERAHVDLEPVAELLDAAEHAYGVAFGEA